MHYPSHRPIPRTPAPTLVHGPKTSRVFDRRFEFDLWIVVDGTYDVWMTLVGEHPIRNANSLVIGVFTTFDEATAACLEVFPGVAIHVESAR